MSRRVEPADYQVLIEDLIANENRLRDRIAELEKQLTAQQTCSPSPSPSSSSSQPP